MPRKRDTECCWTCRLRRKKCGKARPECGQCKSLGITCHRGMEKPAWMDGGSRQRQAARSIKNQIRRSAQHRRGLLDSSTSIDGTLNFMADSTTPSENSPQRTLDSDGPDCAISSQETTLSEQKSDVTGLIHAVSRETRFPRSHRRDSDLIHCNIPPSSCTVRSSSQSSASEDQQPCPVHQFDTVDFEDTFMMKYLDNVFPFLFPFYRPRITETGRSWILTLAKRSAVALHAILSLTSYFITIVLTEAFPGQYEACKKEMWTRLSSQTDSYVAKIQQDVQKLSTQLEQVSTLQRACSMESIIQVLIFEAVLGRSENWTVHFTAALELFEEIIRHESAARAGDLTFVGLLEGIGKPAWYDAEQNHYIWTSEQAGFRFFIALLIVIDAIGSTATERRPALLNHYPLLLADDNDDDGCPDAKEPTALWLSTYFGCQNWVIRAIAETSALASWKNVMKAKGSLSVMELARLARRIETVLDHGIRRLESRSHNGVKGVSKKAQSSYACLRSPPPVSSATATRIWAHAAKLYLMVVVSGWQTSCPEIRATVRHTLTLLQDIDSASHLRALAWPIVVTGSMAEPGQEQQQFKALFENKSDVEMFGAMTEARDILREVWKRSESGSLDGDTWSIGSCLRILGFSASLI